MGKCLKAGNFLALSHFWINRRNESGSRLVITRHEAGRTASLVDWRYRSGEEMIMEADRDDIHALETIIDEGEHAHRAGCLQRAECIYKKALAFAETASIFIHCSLARLLSLLGDVYRQQGKPSKAETYYRVALSIYEKLDPQSIDVCICMKNISDVCWAQSKVKDAELFGWRAAELADAKRTQLEALFRKKSTV